MESRNRPEMSYGSTPKAEIFHTLPRNPHTSATVIPPRGIEPLSPG